MRTSGPALYRVAKLTALGGAAVQSTGGTTGVVLGTPVYMAPEQVFAEKDVDHRADVWALGLILYQCLSGVLPTEGENVGQVFKNVTAKPFEPLEELVPSLPREVAGLVARMIDRDRDRRPPDLREAIEILERYAGAPAAPAVLGGAEQQLVSVLLVSGDPHAHDVAEEESAIALHDALARHGAHVRALADGSLAAVFAGGRRAATDLAAAAARCALMVRERWPHAVVTLATGRGLVGAEAGGGDALDRAVDLSRAATARGSSEAPTVLVEDVTAGLLGARFTIERSRAGCFALLGEEDALDDMRPLLGKPTPCVGREQELAVLTGLLDGCVEESTPRAMLVVAPPGVGKSRLRREFLRRVAARGEAFEVLIARGAPMSAGSAYALLGQALRRMCGVQDGEEPDRRRDRMERRITRHLPNEDARRVVEFIGELCNVPFPDGNSVRLRAARQAPRVMADQIEQAVVDFLRAECRAQPVLLVLEDLHWGDALTVKLVEAALTELRDAPFLVLAVARPDVDELFPRLWSERMHVMRLGALGRRACERLVHQALGQGTTPARVARLVERAAGNVLYLEELIRAEAEGRGDVPPETVLAMLQARIGRLDFEARAALRAGSVFGETFWLGGVRALLGQRQSADELSSSLRALVAAEILEPRRESRFPSETEYRIRHSMLREAAYSLLDDADRQLGHLLAASYLERAGEQDSLVLAEHFQHGGDSEGAIRYYTRAADQSFDNGDQKMALSCTSRGMACRPEGDARAIPALVTTPAMYKEDRTQSPDGTIFLSQLQHLAVKYGHLTEYIPAAPIGYVLPEHIETLKRAGAECWRSVALTKEPVEVRVSRKGESAPLRFPVPEGISDPTARVLLEDILSTTRGIWTTPPREIVDIHRGRIPSGAGSLGQWFSTLVFVNGETRPLGYGSIGGLIQLSRNPEVSLDALKIITGSFIKVPAEFLGYCGLDTLWSLIQRTLSVLPLLQSKDEYYRLMSALALYVNQLNAWNLHYFPWSHDDARYAYARAA